MTIASCLCYHEMDGEFTISLAKGAVMPPEVVYVQTIRAVEKQYDHRPSPSVLQSRC